MKLALVIEPPLTEVTKSVTGVVKMPPSRVTTSPTW